MRQLHQRGGQAGDRRGQRAIQGQIRLHLAIAPVQVGMGGQWRPLTRINKAVGWLFTRFAQEEEATAAEA